jgi:pseudoazurin
MVQTASREAFGQLCLDSVLFALQQSGPAAIPLHDTRRVAAAPRKRKASSMKRVVAAATILAALMLAGGAQAADHEIQMLNKGEKGAMVFQPEFVQAAPGDTVTFVPTDKGHDAESIKGMIPDGAEPFKGKMGEQITVTLDKEGVYGVKCTPHYGMGMVALIVVGQPVNLEQAKAVKQSGKAKKVFEALLAEVPAGN